MRGRLKCRLHSRTKQVIAGWRFDSARAVNYENYIVSPGFMVQAEPLAVECP